MNNDQILFLDSQKISKKDLREIAEIDSAIPNKYDIHHHCDEEMIIQRLEYYRNLLEPYFFKVAFKDDKIIGFHILQSFQWGLIKAARIVTLWVHPDFRGRGISKDLKQAGILWTKEHNFSFIQTSVHKENSRMLEINRQAGFDDFSIIMRLKL